MYVPVQVDVDVDFCGYACTCLCVFAHAGMHLHVQMCEHTTTHTQVIYTDTNISQINISAFWHL